MAEPHDLDCVVLLTDMLAQTMPYRLNEETGLIDYDALEKSARLFRPKLIVAGKGMSGSN
jgi:glycine/serine hydroxymethyltransferase